MLTHPTPVAEYMVYWTEDGQPMQQLFRGEALSAVLLFTEALRQRQRAGEPVRFVTMVSEHPDSVGAPGVDDPPADYHWTKRRPFGKRRLR